MFETEFSSPQTARGPAASHRLASTLRLSIWLLISILPTATLAQSEARRPLSSEPIQQVIAGGTSQVYEFASPAGQYTRLAINRSTAQVVLQVFGPDGKKIAALDCRRCASSSLSFITLKAGLHRVLVSARDAVEVAGRYDLCVAESRALVSSDGKRLAAEDNLARGDMLRRTWEPRATRQALDKYRAALVNSRLAGDRRGQAIALQALGDTWRLLGDLRQAQAYYEQALARASDDTRIRAGAALGLSYTYLFQGDLETALVWGTKALSLSRDVSDRAGESLALVCVGDVYSDMADRTKALSSYENALAIAREADDPAGQALALLNLGYAASDLGEKLTARDFLTKALSGWQLLDERRGQTKTLAALGHVASALGEKQQALKLYHEAARLLLGHGEPATEAPIYAGIGYIYEGLGNSEAALKNYLQALVLWRAAKYRKAEAEALAQVARLYRQQGHLQRALTNILQAKQLSQGIQDDCLKGFIDIHLGSTYQELGRWQEALMTYKAAWTSSQTCGSLWTQSQALIGIADVHYRRGQLRETIPYYEKALKINRALHDVFGEVVVLCNLARSQRDVGDVGAARQRLDEALEKIESLRQQVASRNLRATYFATVREAYELTIDVLLQLDKQQPGANHAADAFEISERARARSLLDTLIAAHVDTPQDVGQELVEQQHGAHTQIANQEQKLAHLYASNASSKLIEEEEQRLAGLLDSYEAIQLRMRETNPRYAALTSPPPLTLAKTQQLLEDDTLLLEFVVGEKRSYLWAVSNTEVHHYELPGRATLDALTRRFYALQTPTTPETEYREQAEILGQVLLGPVAGLLAGKRLVIVPDGVLHYVPFTALSIPSNDGKSAAAYRPLILDHELIYLPSASTLVALRQAALYRQPATKALAIFADPIFSRDNLKAQEIDRSHRLRGAAARPQVRQQAGVKDTGLARLPFSRVEAEAIAVAMHGEDIFQALGLDANLTTLKSADLSQYHIIHFATHGIINSARPELSSLVLSLVNDKGESQNGFLRLYDIYNLNLRADLVVLSACNTALGKEIRGEGLVSLTRGFMYAGAPRVLSSLWKIDDIATAELMKRFYTKMLREGKKPIVALQEAQQEIRQQPRWRSPFYWAAFSLQGEWK